MPHNHEWQSRIKAVEREYVAMRQAAKRFLQAARDDPTTLQENLRHGEILAASNNLEGTYVIRLFAEFETGARQYWRAHWDTDPKTVDLLNGLAARCGIPDTQRDHAHVIRDYRNALVHEREDKENKPPIALARSYLCHFLASCRGNGDDRVSCPASPYYFRGVHVLLKRAGPLNGIVGRIAVTISKGEPSCLSHRVVISWANQPWPWGPWQPAPA